VERSTQINLWYLLLALLAVIWLRDVWVTSQEVEPIAYSEFLQLVQRGKVGEITIRGSTIAGTLTEPLPKARRSSSPRASIRSSRTSLPSTT